MLCAIRQNPLFPFPSAPLPILLEGILRIGTLPIGATIGFDGGLEAFPSIGTVTDASALDFHQSTASSSCHTWTKRQVRVGKLTRLFSDPIQCTGNAHATGGESRVAC